MSLSPSPVEQVNDVVIIHLCWSLLGLQEPYLQLWVTEVRDADKAAWIALIKQNVCG